MSGLQKVWKCVIFTFIFSLCLQAQMHTSSFLKCLKAACSNPSNKQQDDDENPTPHSSDSFPMHLELELPTETGCLRWALRLQPALSPSALLGDTHWTPASCPPHPAAGDTLEQSPAAHTPTIWLCLDLAAQTSVGGVCLCSWTEC